MVRDKLEGRLRSSSRARGRSYDPGRSTSKPKSSRPVSSRATTRSSSRQSTSSHRESNPTRRAEYTYDRVEPKSKQQEATKIDNAKDALAELFAFDIPMRGEKFDFKKFLGTHKKPLLVSIGGLAGAVILLGAFVTIFKLQTNNVAKDGAVTQTTKQVGFNPLVPLGKESKTGADLKDSDFYIDKDKKVLGYSSQFNGAGITVSQQRLPEDMESNPSEGLQQVAAKFGASETIETLRGTAYFKTDENGGKQLVVFATDEHLVFIQTDKELLPDDLEFYINQLSPKY